MRDAIVIVGGGIAGLSAAWELQRAGADFLLLEAGTRFGGVLSTQRQDGFVMERGPDSFLTQKPAAAELAGELGLGPELEGGLSHNGGTLLYQDGRLRPLPRGWMMMAPTAVLPALTTSLLSPATKLRLAWRWWRAAPPAATEEETVAAFLRRHFTRQLVDAVAAPLMAGVYGGDVEELSAAEVLPRFVALEQRGNLLRELRRESRQRRSGGPSLFTTLRRGMGSLPEALVAALAPERLRLQSQASGIEAAGSGYRLRLAGGETIDAGAVIVALPAWAAAELVGGLSAKATAALQGIAYRGAVTVNLAYKVAPALPAGYGFLAPRASGLKILACTFVHQKFGARAPQGGGLLRVFFGAGDANQQWSDAQLLDIAQAELSKVLGISAAPDLTHVARWPQAMAQYQTGHRRRIEAARAALAACPGVHLAGNAYQGIGVPDCIASGRVAARAAVAA